MSNNNKTYNPTTTTQTTGGTYRTFNNIDNIKTKNDSYAQSSSLIAGKNGTYNRPSTITVSNFKTGLPTGSKVTKIEVKYKHSKVSYGNAYPNITAPTISLMNGSSVLKWSDGQTMEKLGQAPTSTPTETTVVFQSSAFNTSIINSSNFGVKIDYPSNANTNQGYLRVYYVTVTVYYNTPNFTLNMKKLSGQYNHDTFEIEITCNNSNKADYNPLVTIDLPTGFSLQKWTGKGTVSTVSSTKYNWTPKTANTTSDTLKITCDCNVTYPSGSTSFTGTFTTKESLGNNTASLPVTVTDKPTDPTIDPTPESSDKTADLDNDSPSKIYFIEKGAELDFIKTIDDLTGFETATWDGVTYKFGIGALVSNTDFTEDYTEGYPTSAEVHLYDLVYTTDGELYRIKPYASSWATADVKIDTSTLGEYTFIIGGCTISTSDVTHIRKILPFVTLFNFAVFPNNLTTPSVSLLTLSQEELNRLGDGYNYTVETMLKEVTSETYVRDWDGNFRIGVFNNAIEDNITIFNYTDENGETKEIIYDSTDYDTLTTTQIYDNADYWSSCPTNVNTYTNLECTFPYNKKYPLYILIVGDYSEATTPAQITYTEPQIIENFYYQGRTLNGNYPYPIDDLVKNDGSTSEISIPALNTSDTIIFYKLPLDDNYGTNTDTAIRGLQINGKLEQSTDNLILSTSLVNDKKISKTRSVVLDETTLSDNNTFTIGQIGDLWGFSTLDIVNLEDWEIHLTLNNALNNDIGSCNFGDVNLTIYTETIEHQSTKCYIEGEDLSYYGVFLTNVTIPEGLKTDVDFLKVDGTDTNDAYRQNIKEKEITVEFTLGDNCDLEGATLSLRELTKLLTTQRDKYNRPIPKRIEFSHYPDVYWEYIMENTIDADIELSSYTCKAKLVIPSGTSLDKKTTSTNTTGFVSGLAPIYPIIQISPTDNLFNITETISDQSFDMGYTGGWTGKIIEIDCANRKVYLKENEDDTQPTNLSRYVDFNSDFFRLHGEYEFTASGCVIRTINYKERW